MIAAVSAPRFDLRPAPRLEAVICLGVALGVHAAVLLAILDVRVPKPAPEPIMVEVIVPQPSAPTAVPTAKASRSPRTSPRSDAEPQRPRSRWDAKPRVVEPAAPAPQRASSAGADSPHADTAPTPGIDRTAVAVPNAPGSGTQLSPAPAAGMGPQGQASATEGAPVQSGEIPPRFDAPHLRNPTAEYPRLARRMGEQGRVVMRVYVSSAGAPERIELQTSSGSPRLDQAAREALARWRFVPARRGSEAVGAWLLVPIVFRLED